MSKPGIAGFGHIDLTVIDGERSVGWWQDVMGFEQVHVREKSNFKVWSLVGPAGMVVSVMTHAESDGVPFDERRVGLDHIAFRVEDRDELEAWVRHLDELGVEHSGIQDELGGPVVVLRDPNNIQLELWAFDATQD